MRNLFLITLYKKNQKHETVIFIYCAVNLHSSKRPDQDIQCLSTLYKYLEEVTERKPEKRFIDAIDLLNKIQATSADLQPLFGAAINNFVKDQEINNYAAKN